MTTLTDNDEIDSFRHTIQSDAMERNLTLKIFHFMLHKLKELQEKVFIEARESTLVLWQLKESGKSTTECQYKGSEMEI